MVELEADQHLRALIVSSTRDAVRSRLPVDALFVCIGGVPRTQATAQVGIALDDAGYIRTGRDVGVSPGAPDGWPLARHPLPLETNQPGLFACGDIRSGSIKRCAAAIGEGSMAVALVRQRLAEVWRRIGARPTNARCISGETWQRSGCGTRSPGDGAPNSCRA